jgi:sulfur carrier protein
MKVTVNGTEMPLPGDFVIAQLLERMGVTGRFAVEINETIAPRSQFATHPLQDGDRIEIVRAVGGG